MWTSFKSDSADEDTEDTIKTYSTVASVLLIIGGLAALIFGGRLFVNAATEIAKGFGVSDKFIAVTVLAAGTSMPELATSIVAAIKHEDDIALGNVIGSNIFNIFCILGITAIISPLKNAELSILDFEVMIGISILLMIMMFTRRKISRIEGLILIAIFTSYLSYLIATM
jgi:cation:H+ antiporter